jgi:tetratricopeptide (TPR) repeat protein
MRSIIIFFLLCISTSTSWCNRLLSTGDSLLAVHQYKLAALAYEMVYMDHQDPGTRQDALYSEAICFDSLGDYELAYHALNRAPGVNLNDSQYFRIKYHTALYAYLTSRYTVAGRVLLQLNEELRDKTIYDQAWYLEMAIYMAAGNYEEAKSLVKNIFNKYHLKVDADSLFGKFPHQKNITFAKCLSVVPGAGQLYTGYFSEGLAAFTLTILSGFYTVWLYESGDVVTSITSGLGLLQRFYIGNIRRAGVLARKKNEALNNAYSQVVKSKLAAYTLLVPN